MSSTTASDFPRITGLPRREISVGSRGANAVVGDAHATVAPVLSIDISRELASVVVTLEGLLDEDSAPALVALLWDLVVGQGNLSVTVDGRRLSLDPSLIWVFQVLEREVDLRGGTLAVVESSPPSALAERDRTAAALDHCRARRAAAGMAAHPAGGARTTQPNRRGAQA